MMALGGLKRCDAMPTGGAAPTRSSAKPPPLAKRGALAWEQAQRDKLQHNVRLVVHAVDDVTNQIYEKEVRTFLLDVKRHGLPFSTYEERDAALGGYISDMCYVMQLPFSRGSALFNGFMHIFEDHRNKLPVAARALKSWSRMGFQKEGAPVPFEAVGCVLYDLFEHGQLYEGAAVLLQLDGWLREQDWGLLRKTDVAVGPDGEVGLTLGRRERGEKVKTGANQGVVVTWQVTKAILRAIGKGAAARDLLFPLSQDKYRRAWRQAFERAGLADFGPPHSLRHAGAAAYIASGGSLEAARRKGRWQTTSALQRYTKVHVLIEQRSRLTPEQLERGRAFWRRPAQKIVEAICRSDVVLAPLAQDMVAELEAAKNDEVVLPQLESMADGGAEPTSRPSTAGRSRARRQ